MLLFATNSTRWHTKQFIFHKYKGQKGT